MNLGAVLVTGLFAGGVSCAAVQGGLLTGLVARQRDAAGRSGTAAARKQATGSAARRAGTVAAHTNTARSATTRSERTAIATAPAATAATTSKAGGGKATKPSTRRARKAPPRKSFRERLADDLTPVGGFLAGKLVAYTMLGALLGALGGVVQLSERLTATAQICAGLLVVAFGLAQLGAPGFRNFTIAPPASWARFVRGRARSQSALAPTLLGAATILVPCGVTLSVEALALTSGSALAGAATMAVFVIGTSPLFAALGYAARKAATAWQGKLAVATGLVVLLLGLYTLNTGLERAGSPITARAVALQIGLIDSPPSAETVTVSADRQEAVVTAGSGSYRPGNVAVKSGVPTTLIVRASGAQGCIRAFVIPSLGKQWTLPVNGDTTIDLGVLQPGKLGFTCAMGMYTGQLTIT